jgi:hypothetical protein
MDTSNRACNPTEVSDAGRVKDGRVRASVVKSEPRILADRPRGSRSRGRARPIPCLRWRRWPQGGRTSLDTNGVSDNAAIASYSVNDRAVRRAQRLIKARQYVLESDWGEVQPRADDENAFLASHSWEEYADWHLGLTEGASGDTKARYAFVYGDFRRVHRSGLIACQYRAAEWRHKEVERAAHELLQLLDETSS